MAKINYTFTTDYASSSGTLNNNSIFNTNVDNNTSNSTSNTTSNSTTTN